MSPKHTNPIRPRRDREGHEIWARAPYNFVPLPDKIVPARSPLDHDSYSQEGLSGWIECEMETCAPTYVRGMFTEEAFRRQGDKSTDKLSPAEKDERAPFYATAGAAIEGYPVPAIPGSSLRGMIRTLVEIASYGRIRWVGREPTFTFRAVAASRDDPLRQPYRDVMGAFGSNVGAGYLVRRGDAWLIQPAQTPRSVGLQEDKPYLKIKERDIQGKDIPDYRRLNSPEYRPQVHPVSFDAEVRSSEKGKYTAVTRIGAPQAGYRFRGTLVCSGNMLETGKEGQRSPRKSHALVLLPDEKARTLKIRPQAIDDYKAGLTPYEREMLTDWSGKLSAEMGCLGDLKPVFYVAEGNEVAYFGHSPNFRIPARLAGTNRAAVPPDFIPQALQDDPRPDLADAIFGWVEEDDGPKIERKPAHPPINRAGRVSFEDAHFVSAGDGVWWRPEPITPRTLGTPKPTTFQHYLVQDARAGHDPDRKETLAHYGTPPEQTQIRGHKLYWHRGAEPEIEASAKERKHETQLTRILPVKPGVLFKFTVHFENLRPEELGALWWALALPGEPGKTYRHKIGMGKPLGMGAIKLTPRLVLSERCGLDGRYAALLDGDHWAEAAEQKDAQPYVEAFEAYLLRENGVAPKAARLAEVERIRALLALLQWREADPAWLEKTHYMEIEHEPNNVNEYKERPVLPDPLAVVGGQPVTPPASREGPKTELPPKPKTPAAVGSTGTLTGTVKMFNEDKGYGFIKQEDGSDIFVHYSNIAGGGRRSLRPGQQVRYRAGKGKKGPEAQDVQPI